MLFIERIFNNLPEAGVLTFDITLLTGLSKGLAIDVAIVNAFDTTVISYPQCVRQDTRKKFYQLMLLVSKI